MTMVGACLAVLIAGAAMLVAPFSPSIAQYSPIIVSYGYAIQGLMAGLIEMITNTESEMPCIERMLEYQALESEQKLDRKCREENKKILKR